MESIVLILTESLPQNFEENLCVFLVLIEMVLHPKIDIESQYIDCVTEVKAKCIENIAWLNLINIIDISELIIMEY